MIRFPRFIRNQRRLNIKNQTKPHDQGAQRLSLDQLRQWEALHFGMFIHFGMSTFTGAELPSGNEPSTLYAPDKLDVGQWVGVARDAGMKYAVLTTKQPSMYLVSVSRGTNLLLDVGPDKHGLIPDKFIGALQRLRANLDRLGIS